MTPSARPFVRLNTQAQTPKGALKRHYSDHLTAAQELDFIASHLDMDERYQIDRQDMQRLGICRENHLYHEDSIPF